MIVYLDASAIVKRYVVESGSAEVEQLLAAADVVGTSLISRAEVSAAIGKAVRVGALERGDAMRALKLFRSHWPYLVRLKLEEFTVSQADELAWAYDLRGYDAVHLASALIWRDMLGDPVTLATFDRQLRDAGEKAGLNVWPENLD